MPNDCGNCGNDCDYCCSDCCADDLNGYGTDKIYQPKKPTTSARHIGIEIEFITPLSPKDMGDLLVKEGFEEKVCLKEDGSIDSDENEYGHEVTLLTTEKSFVKDINKLCLVLNEKAEARVDASCGLHIHLDMRNRNKEAAFKNLVKIQDFLYKMQPHSRRRSTFCKPTPINWKDALYEGRYLAINASAYDKFKTIEVRVHSGTTNATKITNWVSLLLRVINKRKPVTKNHQELSSLIKEIKLSSKLRRYIAERIKLFQDVA